MLVDPLMKYNNHFVLDVESDGPHPMAFNMISFGLVNLEDMSKTYLGEVYPIYDDPGIPEARAVSGISFEDQQEYRPAHKVMIEAHNWIREITLSQRAIFWSDNPAFDWQFWNAYSHHYAGDNPAGWSARKIGDYAAGLSGNPRNTTRWKRKRKTKHDHNPVNDALGNAQALRKLLERNST